MSEADRTNHEVPNQTLIELTTTIIAAATFFTALLVHFGWIRGRAYYGYFGINQGVLNQSVQDYLFRSADVTFGAILRVMTAGAFLIVVDRVLDWWRTRRGVHRVERWLQGLLAVFGVFLSALGIGSAFGVVDRGILPPVVGAAVLGFGAVIVLRLGSVLLHRLVPLHLSRLAGPMITVTVLVLAAFWTSTLYAQDVGQQAAKNVDVNPRARLPIVTVFSREYLDLPGSSIVITPIVTPRNDVYYRYAGLSLLTYSNGRWFLITGRSSSNYRSSVVTLQDSEGIRVEVARPSNDDDLDG